MTDDLERQIAEALRHWMDANGYGPEAVANDIANDLAPIIAAALRATATVPEWDPLNESPEEFIDRAVAAGLAALKSDA